MGCDYHAATGYEPACGDCARGESPCVINLTPHSITLCGPDGEVLENFPPSGTIARVASTPGTTLTGYGLPVPVTGPATFGAVQGLPAPRHGVFYVVSGLVASRPECADRWDVLSPGNLVRDGAGQPVGCDGLKAAAPLPKCSVCGGTLDPQVEGLSLEDQGHWGGLGGCGDLHSWPAGYDCGGRPQ